MVHEYPQSGDGRLSIGNLHDIPHRKSDADSWFMRSPKQR
jgi:hypothetical protein